MNIRIYRKKNDIENVTYYIKGIDEKGGIELALWNCAHPFIHGCGCVYSANISDFKQVFEFACWSEWKTKRGR